MIVRPSDHMAASMCMASTQHDAIWTMAKSSQPLSCDESEIGYGDTKV